MTTESLLSLSDPDDAQHIARLVALGLAANGMVHDITNPLNAIVMHAELGLAYLQQEAGQQPIEEILRTIISETKRAGMLARRISEFAQASDYSPSDYTELKDLLAQVRTLLGSKLRRSGVDFSVRQEEDVPPLRAKPFALALAIASLVEMAIEGGSRKISLSASRKQSVLELRLHYSGAVVVWENNYIRLIMTFVERIFADHQALLSVDTETGCLVQFPLATGSC